MKRFLPLLLSGLLIFTAACETDQVETMPEDAPVAEADRQMFNQEVESNLSTFDQEISELEARFATLEDPMDADTTDEDVVGEDAVLGDTTLGGRRLAEVRDEREDIVTLQQEAMQAETAEEFRDVRRKMREEMRDLDVVLTEARLETAEDMATFRQTLQSEMDELDRNIEELEAEAANLDEQARMTYDEQIAELRQQREAFQEEWNQFEGAAEDNWEEMKDDLIAAWTDVQEFFYRVEVPDVDVDVETDYAQTDDEL